jgi:hypothetical protein
VTETIVMGATSAACTVAATIVGIAVPGPWGLLGLLLLIPIAVVFTVMRRRLTRGN